MNIFIKINVTWLTMLHILQMMYYGRTNGEMYSTLKNNCHNTFCHTTDKRLDTYQ